MNVTVIVIEQLDWDGSLRTLTFAPSDGADFWVARLDEFHDSRTVPFHVLDSSQERELERRFRRVRSRMSAGFRQVADGIEFSTQWRGIRTERSGMSCYAIALPREAVPDVISFTDPHEPHRDYRYRAVYDSLKGCVVCFLECRSKLGAFDFDLRVRFRRDTAGCSSFVNHDGGTYMPDFQDLGRMASFHSGDEVVIQQFFDTSISLSAGDRSIIVNQADVHGPIIGEISGSIGAIGPRSSGKVRITLEDALAFHGETLRAELQSLLQGAQGDAEIEAEVALAVKAVDVGDLNAASGAFRRIGLRGLHLARDLGVNLVAAIIAAQLGI